MTMLERAHGQNVHVLTIADSLSRSLLQEAFSFDGETICPYNTANNNISKLNGSIPGVDFVDSSSANTFVGTNGSYNSTAAIVSGGIDSDLLVGFINKTIAEIRFEAMKDAPDMESVLSEFKTLSPVPGRKPGASTPSHRSVHE